MLLITAIVVLAALKYFEVGVVANLSWWWIVGLFGVTFLWFEVGERIFGLDKKKSHDKLEEARKERVKKAFDKKR